MKKIILDTNIFVSAILGPSGASRIVLRDCLKEKFLPLMGEALFREYEDLLQREHIFAGCVLGKDDRNLLLDAFLRAKNGFYYGPETSRQYEPCPCYQ
jgi:predicted nucleic acid-binding protein